MNGEFVVGYSSLDVPVPDDCIIQRHENGEPRTIFIDEDRDIIAEWEPEDPTDVAIELTLEIGLIVAGQKQIGATLFFTGIYTKKAIDRIRSDTGAAPDTKGAIVVHEFDWPKIKQSIENILKKCERDTFEDSMRELAKRFCADEYC